MFIVYRSTFFPFDRLTFFFFFFLFSLQFLPSYLLSLPFILYPSPFTFYPFIPLPLPLSLPFPFIFALTFTFKILLPLLSNWRKEAGKAVLHKGEEKAAPPKTKGKGW